MNFEQLKMNLEIKKILTSITAAEMQDKILDSYIEKYESEIGNFLQAIKIVSTENECKFDFNDYLAYSQLYPIFDQILRSKISKDIYDKICLKFNKYSGILGDGYTISLKIK